MNRKQPEISIITVLYNEFDVLFDFSDSLKRSTFKDYELIIIDNGSKENPKKMVNDLFPHCHYIRSETNLGFAGGNNLGIKMSKGRYCFFINNDTVLDPNCIKILYHSIESIPDAGAISPKIQYYFNKNILEYAGYTEINNITGRNRTIGGGEMDMKEYSGLFATEYAHGAAMLVPKKVIDDVGYMPEIFFLYYEELDWCEQMKNKRYKIYCQRDALIKHKVSMSTGKESPLKSYFLHRNRVLFMRRKLKKRFELYVFIMYYVLVSFLIHLLKRAFRSEWNHFREIVRALLWNLKNNSVR